MMDLNFKEADRLANLLSRKVTGELSDAERAELDAWVISSERRRLYAEQLAQATFIAEEHRRKLMIDQQKALRQMQERIAAGGGKRARSRISGRALLAAAAVAVMVAAGSLVWWRQYAKVVPPTLPEAVQTAMEQSRKAGRAEAVIENWRAGKTATERPAETSSEADNHSYDFGLTQDQATEQLLQAHRVTTHEDKEYWLRLDDGTLIHLNSNTRLVYPEQFSGTTRDVIIDGEAYFMVARDRRHPFVVHTPQGAVRVYGTEFNVSTRSSDGAAATEVVLVKGAVGVTPNGGQEQTMVPGEKCLMSQAQCAKTQVDVQPYVSWNTGYFTFDNCSLEQLMQVLSKWYGCRVTFVDKTAAEKHFTGEIDRYASIEPTLEAIGRVTGLLIEKRGEEVTIRN